MPKTKNKPGIHLYKNSRKVPGAYVWYKCEAARITNQVVDKGFVIVENLHKVSKKDLRLIRAGDTVVFKDLKELPARCSELGVMKVASFLDNDTIQADKDEFGSHYSHFKLSLQSYL